jgi:hypothetical protein
MGNLVHIFIGKDIEHIRFVKAAVNLIRYDGCYCNGKDCINTGFDFTVHNHGQTDNGAIDEQKEGTQAHMTEFGDNQLSQKVCTTGGNLRLYGEGGGYTIENAAADYGYQLIVCN